MIKRLTRGISIIISFILISIIAVVYTAGAPDYNYTDAYYVQVQVINTLAAIA